MKIEELFNAMANLIFKLAVSHTVLPLLLRGQFFSGTCIPHLPSQTMRRKLLTIEGKQRKRIYNTSRSILLSKSLGARHPALYTHRQICRCILCVYTYVLPICACAVPINITSCVTLDSALTESAHTQNKCAQNSFSAGCASGAMACTVKGISSMGRPSPQMQDISFMEAKLSLQTPGGIISAEGTGGEA